MKLISEVPVLSLTAINEQSLINQSERAQLLDIYKLIILIGLGVNAFSIFIFGPTFDSIAGLTTFIIVGIIALSD
jgi:hypothetical protein